METANPWAIKAFRDGQIFLEDRLKQISKFMKLPGTFKFTVPDGDGCTSLPAGSVLYVSPSSQLPEGLHILKNVKTGEQIARWICNHPTKTLVKAFKKDGPNHVDVMMIGISGPEFEWIAVGTVKFSWVYLGGDDIQHGPGGPEQIAA